MKNRILSVILVIIVNFTALPTVYADEATPIITNLPVAEAIYAGEPLSLSRLYFGEAKYGGTLVEGTFSWKDPSVKPALSDNDNTRYRVVFTPNDNVTYSSVELDVTLKVYEDRDDNLYSFVWHRPDLTVGRPDMYDTLTIGWGFRDKNNVWYKPQVQLKHPVETAKYAAEWLIQQPRGMRALDLGGWIYNDLLESSRVNSIFYDTPMQDNSLLADFNVGQGQSACTVVRQFTDSFFSELAAMDIDIDYIYGDMETIGAGLWNITKIEAHNGGEEAQWNAIWNDDRFQSELLPKLLERGFVLCTETGKNPLYYVKHYSVQASDTSYLKTDYNIWNTVMYNYISDLYNKYVYDVIALYYPNAKLSNYNGANFDGWYNETKDSHRYYLGGSKTGIGNTDCPVLYGDAERVWKASSDDYELFGTDTPFASLIVNVNEMRNSLLSSDSTVAPYVANAFYSGNASQKVSITEDGTYEYYKEMLLHIAMCDPDSLIQWSWEDRGQITGDDLLTNAEIMTIASDVYQAMLDEVNEMVGYSDRHTLVTELTSPNDKFVVTGMYANGQNVWRITPDLSVPGITVENFCTNTNPPTFNIGGKTVTFPGGTIYKPTGSITSTRGYWVVTPEDVTPIITSDSDIYEQQPVYLGTLDGYNIGDPLQPISPNTQPTSEKLVYFTNQNPDATIVNDNGNKVAQVSTGSCVARGLNDVNVAGQYAKHQVWEMRVKLSQITTTDTIGIFNYGAKSNWTGISADSELQITGDKVMYKIGGEYQSIMTDGNTLSANKWYTFRREMDFSTEGFNRSSICVMDSTGNVVAKIEDAEAGRVPTNEDGYVALVTRLIFHYGTISNPVYFDDFKIYPTGANENFQLFVDSTGVKVKTTELPHKQLVGKLTYLNGSGATANYEVYCEQYDASGNVLSNCRIFDEAIHHGDDGYLLADMPAVMSDTVAMRVYCEGEGTAFSQLYGKDISNIAVTGEDSVAKGGSQPYTATMTNTDKQMQLVSWSVVGNTSAATRVDSLGVLTVGADENSTKVTVIATSIFDTTKSGGITVNVLPTVATVTSVTVIPDSATVESGSNISFEATVTGENGPSQAVVWSVSGNSAASTAIDAMGKLIVGTDETEVSLTVTATSLIDSAKYGVAMVTVQLMPNLVLVESGNNLKLTVVNAVALGVNDHILVARYNSDGKMMSLDPFYTKADLDANGTMSIDKNGAALVNVFLLKSGIIYTPICNSAQWSVG